jgi:hypothetical protein
MCCIILFEAVLSTKIAINAKLFALGTSEITYHWIAASRRRTGAHVCRRHDLESEAITGNFNKAGCVDGQCLTM